MRVKKAPGELNYIKQDGWAMVHHVWRANLLMLRPMVEIKDYICFYVGV